MKSTKLWDMPQKQNQFVGKKSRRDQLEITEICSGKKVLNKMMDNRFEGDYIEFAKDIKAYANKYFK